jgi:hypothetical protein
LWSCSRLAWQDLVWYAKDRDGTTLGRLDATAYGTSTYNLGAAHPAKRRAGFEARVAAAMSDAEIPAERHELCDEA